MKTLQQLSEAYEKQKSAWDASNTPLDYRIFSLRQFHEELEGLVLDHPELVHLLALVGSNLSSLLDQSRTPESHAVDDAMIQMQNLTSMYFHDQSLSLPSNHIRVQNQKKAFIMLKVLMGRIQQNLYPDAPSKL